MPIYSKYTGVGGGTSYTFVGVAPISVTNVAGTVTTSMTQSSSTTNGWLSSTDWSTFNSKQSALTFGNLTEATSSVLTISGGTGAVIGSGTSIQVKQSSGSQSGYLSSSDWTTFNNKQNALTFGNLTGDTNAQISISGGTGAVIGSGTSISQSAASASSNGYLTSSDWSAFNSKQPAGSYITALTGEVTATGPGSVAATIANGVVTNSKLANMAANTLKGNNTLVSATPLDLTTAQVTAMLNTFTSALQGLVPASGGGTSNYLRADGSWSPISVFPTQTGNVDKVLATDGTNVSWQYAGLGAGSLGSNNVVLGRSKPTSMAGTANTIVGSGAAAALTSASSVVCVGSGSGTLITSGSNCVVIGTNASSPATSLYNVVVGDGASCSSSDSVAIGRNASASNQYGIAIGDLTVAAARTVSIGSRISGGGQFSVAIGKDVSNSGSSSIVLGHSASDRGESNVLAIGSQGLGNISTVYIGTGAAFQTVTQAVKIMTQQASGTNTNLSASTLTLAGSRSTGNAAGSSVFIATAPAGASGTTLNAHVNRLEVVATNSGDVKVLTGDLMIETAGKGLKIKDGANSKIGVTTAFPGGGTNTVTVSTTAVTANSIIFVAAQSGAGTIDPKLWVSAITAGTSFVISSGDNSFVGTVGWLIVDYT